MSGSTILWIIIIGGLFFWMMRKGGCGAGHGGHDSGGGEGHSGHGEEEERKTPGMVKDPVCGMFVDPKNSLSSRHMNATFYFCSQACKDKFSGEPMKYMKMKKETKKGGCCG